MPGEREGIHGEEERLTDDERQYLSLADRGDIGGMADLRERSHTAIPDFALNKLWMSLLEDDVPIESLSFARTKLGVVPDEAFIRDLQAAKWEDPKRVLALIRVTGIQPRPSTLGDTVRRAFEREEYGTLEEIKHLLGDLPAIEHADLLRRYEKHLQGLETVRIIELFETVGIPVLGKEQLAGLFEVFLTHGRPADALDLERLAGTRFDANPDNVRQAWVQAIESANTEDTYQLNHRFGPPGPEIIQEGYQEFFQSREAVNSGYDGYLGLRAALGVDPSEALVQSVYREEIINQRFDTFRKLYAMFHRFPSRDVIQEGYEKFIALGRVGLISKLNEITGIKPDREVARRGLLEFFKSKDRFFIGFKSILSELDYIPDAEEVRVFTDAIVTRLPTYEVLNETDNLSWQLAQDQVELLYSRAMVLKDYETAATLKRRSETPLASVDESVLLDELDDLRVKLDEGDPKKYLETFRGLRDAWPSGVPLPDHPHEWGKMFERLSLAFPPASREEYDPWETELKPLLDAEVLSTYSPAEAEIFYDFIQEFGMYNLPTILRWHAAIRRAKDVKDIANNEYVEIQELLDRSIADFPNPGAVVVEIKKFRRRLQESLLADEIPGDFNGPGQEAAIELFNSLKGDTSWERDQDTFEEMLMLQKFAREKNPEHTKVPDGYEPATLTVSRIEEREGERDVHEAIDEILTNPDVRTFLERYDAAFHAALDAPTLEAWWGTAREAVLQLVEHELANVKRLYEQATDEKKKRAMERKLAAWEGRRDEIASLTFPELPSDPREADREIVQFLERLIVQLPPKLPGREDLLRGLSAAHILRVIPEHWKEMVEVNLKKDDEPWDTGQAFTYADVLRQYLNEHYLHPAQGDHDRVMHAPFSKELLRELRGVWGLKGDLNKHPLLRAREKIDHIMRSGTVKSEKKMDVTMVPVKGLLRTYAGDIGDACYTSQHRELARGEFPGITAFIFVTGRGTTNERLRGSVLAVETKTPAGDGVLVIRANNPQEGLLQQVDRDELVRGTLDALIALAERRGLRYVVAPQDGSSASQTNRESVAEFYDQFGDAPRLLLVDEPETNFNGYKNWDPRSYNRVGVVWERGVGRPKEQEFFGRTRPDG